MFFGDLQGSVCRSFVFQKRRLRAVTVALWSAWIIKIAPHVDRISLQRTRTRAIHAYCPCVPAVGAHLPPMPQIVHASTGVKAIWYGMGLSAEPRILRILFALHAASACRGWPRIWAMDRVAPFVWPAPWVCSQKNLFGGDFGTSVPAFTDLSSTLDRVPRMKPGLNGKSVQAALPPQL
jgi:hypothetical protein